MILKQLSITQRYSLGCLFFLLFLVLMVCVTWPLRDIALVYWVYGSAAYHEQGIRVVDSKPTRFSNGQVAPHPADLATGFLAIFAAIIAAMLLTQLCYCIYRRCSSISKRQDA